MSYITDISTQSAEYRYTRDELIHFLEVFVKDPIALRKLKFIANESGIDSKHSVLSDFKLDQQAKLFVTDAPYASTEERLKAFAELAGPMAHQACEKVLESSNINPKEITAIIAVSCTGMSAPGIEIELCKSLGLSSSVERHAINFMGCYATFHGMRLADYICTANPDAKVLLVSVELCSLHFRVDGGDDNLLSTTLFSDGAGAMIISGRATNALAKVDGFNSNLIPEGAEDMAWRIGNTGFEMVLNKHVPKHIENGMASAIDSIANKLGVSRSSLVKYAIHPGGKNVLNAFARALEIEPSSLEASHSVLRNFGNISSVSIIFVLHHLLKKEHESDEKIYAAAFGPGLTIESAILTTV